MAGYLAQSIRHSYPSAELHWMVEDRCAEIVQLMEVATVHAVPRKQWREKGDLKTLVPQFRWLSQFRRFGFDVAIDLQGHSKTGWATRLSRAKARVSSRCTDIVAKRLNPQFGRVQTGHEIEWNHLVAKSILGELSPVDSHPFQTLFPSSPEKNRVSICTGAGHPSKVIPLEVLRDVSKLLFDRGFEVTLVGGAKDASFEQLGVLNLVGKTTLREMVEIIRTSEVHIAGDTGSGHIAAAIGTPLVSVWGNMPLERYRPRTNRMELIESGVFLVQPEDVFDACLRLVR